MFKLLSLKLVTLLALTAPDRSSDLAKKTYGSEFTTQKGYLLGSLVYLKRLNQEILQSLASMLHLERIRTYALLVA